MKCDGPTDRATDGQTDKEGSSVGMTYCHDLSNPMKISIGLLSDIRFILEIRMNEYHILKSFFPHEIPDFFKIIP